MDVDDLEGYVDRWSRAHGGYDARSSPSTMLWLRIAHRLGAPLARRGVPPTRVTLLGGVVAVAVGAVAALGGRWPVLAAALVVVLALLDGVDGAVAELTDSATGWGRVVDQLVDRVGDLSMVAGLWALGAPGPLCAVAAVLTVLDEAIRGGAAAEGVGGVGLVSFPERPARLVIGGVALLGAGVVPSVAGTTVTVAAGLWTLLAVVATVQLVVNVRRQLLGRPRNVAEREDS
ncbi:CDP-alcohol phosphatidyltransferase family protein [Actinomycetospora succinea]|uniref:CDP-alcohol phosphatidyltransferase family protein n=1 Tax=Actinomycetospora succinea TaxID=663603 RepID=UPI001415225F|nr:CDP-alcohol phosphatidyltransferase family protein [Actinomycetospora succinea]